MRTRRLTTVLLSLALCLVPGLDAAAAVGTSFTYQGRLDSGTLPVTGNYDFVFRLFNDPAAGTQVGADQSVLSWPVTEGLFSVGLDFGPGVFDGTALWLEIDVRADGAPAFETLAPRQALTAAPYALYALSAPSGGGGSSQWISNGPDLTYAAGGVGILGSSSPFAAGKGVFLEGGNASYANIFAFNYDAFQPLSLSLNAPGGNVGIGTTAPNSRLEVVSTGGPGIRSTGKGSTLFGLNAAVIATGTTGTGLFTGAPCMGLYATSTDDRAVAGFSTNSWGVSGDCTSAGTYGILGTLNEGVYGFSPAASHPGGRFVNAVAGAVALDVVGLAKVKSIQIVGGADLAERFPSNDEAEPGTVMAIDPDAPGHLCVARGEYCRQVAGVVSGAHDLAAGVVLSESDVAAGTLAIAMTGRVWVRCEAGAKGIRPGDLLTTSARPGLAMPVRDAARAQGAVLGKAMTSLAAGTGMVLVLVSLQ